MSGIHACKLTKVSKIAQALLESSSTYSKICHCTPRNAEHNCTFLVDQSKLKLQSNLKADDCGSWKNNGVCCVVIYFDSRKTTVVAREKETKAYKIRNGQYLLTRNYFTHRASEDFRKIIFTLSGECIFDYSVK